MSRTGRMGSNKSQSSGSRYRQLVELSSIFFSMASFAVPSLGEHLNVFGLSSLQVTTQQSRTPNLVQRSITSIKAWRSLRRPALICTKASGGWFTQSRGVILALPKCPKTYCLSNPCQMNEYLQIIKSGSRLTSPMASRTIDNSPSSSAD